MKKFTVTIGIPAYNEEANIKNLLLSVLAQKEEGFLIKEIIVISDGSTDETVKKVKEIKDKRIKLFEYKKRIGKSQHLNNLFKLAKGEILVLFDSDVILANPTVIKSLIQPLIVNKRVGLVGGNPIPRTGVNFIEKSINASFIPYNQFRIKYKNGNNAFGCDGRILALSRSFFSSTYIPKDMIANDAFMYFCCITNGFEFRHVPEAKVWYRSPTTLRDHFRQNKRFIAAHYRLEKVFGKIVPEEYKIPKSLKYWLLFIQFISMPINSLFIFMVNLYINYRAKKEERKMTALWPMALTTKKGIKND